MKFTRYFTIIMFASIGLSSLITIIISLLGIEMPMWGNIIVGMVSMAMILWTSKSFCEDKKSAS